MSYSVKKRFQMYNALFLNMSYQGANDFGHLIPVLGNVAKQKLEEGNDPRQIFDEFYRDYKDIIKISKVDFMFKVIHYVERQIVLFDSIEDSISPYDLEDQEVVLIQDLVGRLGSDPKDLENLLTKLNEFAVRIVLTAHPTQFYRSPVLDIISKLREQVKNNDVKEIDRLLHQLGLTSLVNSKSPTPIEEAKNIIHICRYEYYDAIGKFIHQLQKEYPGFDNEQLVGLGFWPCGDRDGNAFVTHETTNEVIDVLRMTLMKCYYNDSKDLSAKLTFKEAEPYLKQIQDDLYMAMFDSDKIVSSDDILESLLKVKELVVEKYESLYLDDLEELITKVRVFKNHFASLDIRQDHSVHYATITEVLKANKIIESSLDELDEERLIALCTEEFVDVSDLSGYEGLVLDTLQNLRQLKSIQKKNGEEGCHRYIISNSEDIFSVLFVMALFRWTYKSEEISFDIIPLFETMKGMEESRTIMKRLYDHPVYKKHLKARLQKQVIMLGFSDGTKDGGYFKANWSIYKCKESLSILSREYAHSAVFFDGRGGPPARGGGKTHNFYASRSASMANNEIQLTIQGQTITSTYGTSAKFTHNAEQMVTSGLISLQKNVNTELSTEQRVLLEELSDLSFEKYLSLKEHPKFLPYLENMTTLKHYSKAKIGSRPGKRNKSAKLSLKDLRAISYVGSWSQLKQNIPGYYGVGTALNAMKKAGKLDQLKALYKEAPLFKTLIDNSMMSLTKCYFELSSYMKQNSEFGKFWEMIYEEYKLSKQMVLELAELDALMQKEQQTKDSIMIRDEIVRPLLLVQHYALQMLNSNTEPEFNEVYEKLVIRSLYGNINASRNSA